MMGAGGRARECTLAPDAPRLHRPRTVCIETGVGFPVR